MTPRSLAVSLDDIVNAQKKISSHLSTTPISRLSVPKIDQKVFLKLDILQRTGSFKERGALNALLDIKENSKTKKIIGASAGNHAQAVSYHGQRLGLDVSMVMPEQTPLNKILSTKRWGATIELEGQTIDQGNKIASQRAVDQGMDFLHAYDDARVIAGQGVCALEIIESLKDIDTVVVPVGGGGYMSGISTVFKSLSPNTRVIGVQTEVYPQMATACTGKTYQASGQTSTIADGIAVKGIGELTFPILKQNVDEFVLVSESEIAQAVFYLLQHRKILAEGAGAAGFAAILSKKIKFKPNERIVTTICGGNIDMSLLARITEKEFLKQRRLLKLNVVTSDRPGSLHQLTGVIAESGANIVQIRHDRASIDLPFYNTGTELVIETKGEDHSELLLERLNEHCNKVEVMA